MFTQILDTKRRVVEKKKDSSYDWGDYELDYGQGKNNKEEGGKINNDQLFTENESMKFMVIDVEENWSPGKNRV